jgi:hypothetical protein
MHDPEKLVFEKFDQPSFLAGYKQFRQIEYIRNYLSDLGAKSIIEEKNYFDRDYLSEFSEFYSVTSCNYPNVCKRVHIFSINVDREKLGDALAGDTNALQQIRENYIGFIVLRPIEHAPLGRTVLRWYPDNNENLLRRTNPSRTYKAHLAGIELEVDGLAWQQQDEGVASCATVALWSMLHSSAFDDFHYIPTTSEITIAANRLSVGKTLFPSPGLHDDQIKEAIKANSLTPVEVWAPIDEIEEADHERRGFTVEDFAGTCAAFLRSGYPILLIGLLYEKSNGESEADEEAVAEEEAPSEVAVGNHAVLVVGFREGTLESTENISDPRMLDSGVKYIYIHDDNLGPNVRFEIKNIDNRASLVPSAPQYCQRPDLFNTYEKFVPHLALAAVNSGIRVTPTDLYKRGLRDATYIQNLFNEIGFEQPVSLSVRFVELWKYLHDELGALLDGKLLRDVTLKICEEVPPMSLHLGLVRCAVNGIPAIDFLYDTTGPSLRAFTIVLFSEDYKDIVSKIEADFGEDFGIPVEAFVEEVSSPHAAGTTPPPPQ